MEPSETEALDSALREWIRDDLPLGMKMMLLPEHCDALIDRFKNELERRKAPPEPISFIGELYT